MAKQDKEKEVEVKEESKKLVMRFDVIHDGETFKKDSECPEKHKEFFKKQGFVK